jgi:septum formation protein
VSPHLILASASPRRAHILETLGVRFRVVVPRVDETLLRGEAGAEAVERLARAKAEAVASTETLPVLAADTVVLSAGAVLGKPDSAAQAAAMLKSLSGCEHEVVSGVCIVSRGSVLSGIERTAVVFDALTQEEVDWYVATGEPGDKAGAYHVDGLGALFVKSVVGSPSNVAGLPVRLVRRLARDAGLSLGLP